ncbi:MAG: electron transport complex subunit RsxC [Candidatus Latescibacteria bacterium]|jgi:Na+-translocating ferredoxin:NAD+ oxidoreductase subunit C|nr:electron transport complex subunit RsxC [Candidatus Latescibacterota bacterium]
MARTFRGGVHSYDGKLLSKKCEIDEMSLPQKVVLPVSQHIGAPASVVVNKDDHVKKGQVVAEAGGFVSSPVHASISGTVKAVESRYTPLGKKADCVVIESDDEDVWADDINSPRDISSMKPKDMRDAIQAAGIVGLGGAAFPTHVKLSPPENKPIDTVILNGVECEPYSTCDHRLMIERPGDIIEGFKIIMNILDCKKGIIGIELNKPDAIKVMRETVKDVAGVSVEGLKVKYPQGGEKQLIYAVTKRKVPAGGLPMDVGCVVQNVGTSAAIYEAVALGRPLIQRVVTVTGDGVQKPANVITRLGDSFARLIEQAGGYTDKAAKLIMGGPMMGISQFTDEVPVVKGTSCLLALEENQIDMGSSLTCISCGRCVDVCPMNLMATRIARSIEYERWDDAKEYGILDCMECGSCSYICPAKCKLVENIKFGKAKLAQLRAEEQARQKAAEENSKTANPA